MRKTNGWRSTTTTKSQTTIPGFRRTSYHPLIRVGGFVAIILGIWVIAQNLRSFAVAEAPLAVGELAGTLGLTVLVLLLIAMFVFEQVPTR